MPLWLLSPLHKALRQITVHISAITTGYGLSSEEGHLLTYVASYGPCPITELARVFGLSASTLTGILDRMELAGHLARRPNAADRRSYLIEATAAGQATARELNVVLARFEAEVREQVADDQIAGFRAVMQAVQDVTQVELRGGKHGND